MTLHDRGTAAGDLVVRLHQAIAVARLHEATNIALDAPVHDLRKSLSVVLGAEGSASVKPEIAAEMVFVNDRAVRVRRQASSAIDGLLRMCRTLNLGEIRFQRALSEDQVKVVLVSIREGFAAPTPREALERVRDGLRASGLGGIVDVLSIDEAAAVARSRTLDVDDTTAVRLGWARTLTLLREFVERRDDPELGQYFWRKLVRAVQGLQALAARAPRELLSLTAVKDADDPSYVHAVNTCVLALLLGREAKLSRVRLAPLGLAALLHGIGKLDLEPALVAKSEHDRTPDEQRAYAAHPYRAFSVLLQSRRFDESALVSALVAFQYEAGTGVPETRAPLEEVHPLARLVAVCEAYDALTMPGPGRPPYRPDQALALLLAGRPRPFDLVALGLFANMLGLYPPGTAVRLATGEIAVVIRPNDDPRRPVVAVLRDPGGEDTGGAILDLSFTDEGGWAPPTIASAIDPLEHGIDLAKIDEAIQGGAVA